MTWRDDQTLLVEELTFTLRTWDFDKLVSSGHTFVLLKDRPFVEEYARVFAQESVDRVLEFGVYHGGNLLLMYKGFGEGKVVGIDSRRPEPELIHYLQAAGLTERIVGALCDESGRWIGRPDDHRAGVGRRADRHRHR